MITGDVGLNPGLGRSPGRNDNPLQYSFFDFIFKILFIYFIYFFIVVVFAIHWHESAIDLHVLPILILPPPYSCLGNPMDRGAWQATMHGIEKEFEMTELLSTCMCITDSLCCTPETNTTLWINYMLIKLFKINKNLNIKKKKNSCNSDIQQDLYFCS